jgi:heat shock protein HslJ
MKKQLFNGGLVGAVLCGVVACSSVSPSVGEPVWTPQALLGSQWVEAGPTVGQFSVSLDIAHDASLSGSSGCNRYMGKAEISSTSVRLRRIGATSMLCFAQEVMDKESRFGQALDQTRSVQKQQEMLLLLDEAGKVLWRFKPRT